VNTFDEGFEGPGDGVGDEEDESGACEYGHEAEAEKEMIEAQKIGVGFPVGLEDDDVRCGLEARSEFDGGGVIALVAES